MTDAGARAREAHEAAKKRVRIVGPPPSDHQIREYVEARSVPEPNTGCWLWTGSMIQTTGYGRAFICSWRETAHRAAFRAWHGAIPAGMLVCHRCDTPACVNPSHLWLGTVTDNNRDSASKGRNSAQQRPEKYMRIRFTKRAKKGVPPPIKLSPIAATRIRQEHTAGVTQRRLAEQFGVSRTTIQRILAGKTWAAMHDAAPPLPPVKDDPS